MTASSASTTVTTIPVGAFQVNCYILQGVESALVIDPGADPAELIEHLEQAGTEPAAYVLTHGHGDHLGALAALTERYPATVYLHESDARWAFTELNQILPYYPAPRKPDAPLVSIQDGQVIEAAGWRLEVLTTPGHSPGSVCLQCREARAVFTGDTLFAGSVGRTDLPAGDARALGQSLKRLAVLPRDWNVYPGHGPSSTIAEEQRRNFYLQRLA